MNTDITPTLQRGWGQSCVLDNQCNHGFGLRCIAGRPGETSRCLCGKVTPVHINQSGFHRCVRGWSSLTFGYLRELLFCSRSYTDAPRVNQTDYVLSFFFFSMFAFEVAYERHCSVPCGAKRKEKDLRHYNMPAYILRCKDICASTFPLSSR